MVPSLCPGTHQGLGWKHGWNIKHFLMIDLGVTFPDKQQKSRKHNTIENELPNRHMCQLAYEKDKGSLGLRLCA